MEELLMTRRKTHEEFIKEVIELHGDIYNFLTEYVGSKSLITIQHKFCGYIRSIAAGSLITKRNKGKVICPKCNNKLKLTTETFKQKVYDLVENEYEVLGDYVDSNTPIKMLHKKCLNAILIRPGDFFKGIRCSYCAGLHKLTTEEFKQKVYNLVKDEYIVLGEYINSKTPVKIKHNIPNCNHVFELIPNKFIHRKQRCPKCHQDSIICKKNFKDKVYEKYGDEYIILEEYKGGDMKIKFKHSTDDCGKIFYKSPEKFWYREQLCPFCNIISKGEKKISEFLQDNNILYQPQYHFNDCKYIGELRFDFAIFNYDQELIFLLEYDGIQHFEPVDFAGRGNEWAEENFYITQECDKIKNTYCIDNDIKLFRIPYTEYENIETILNNLIYDIKGGNVNGNRLSRK
jgi:hypothetical protein